MIEFKEAQKQRRRLHNLLGRAVKMDILTKEDKRRLEFIRSKNFKRIKKQ